MEKTVDTVGEHAAEQQKMAKQIAETGQAVESLTLAQIRFEEAHLSDADTASEVLADLRPFQQSKQPEPEIPNKTTIPKQHMPTVFFPKVNGEILLS